MALNRFQVKLTGGETATIPDSGRVVGWRFEFFSCQPAPVSLLVGDQEVQVDEGLFLPASAVVRLKFADPVATVGATLVLEKA